VDLSGGEYRFLIIACDGLWDVVSNEKAIEIVDKYPEPVRAASALRDYAHLLGSTDNISVIVFKLDFDRKEPPSPSASDIEIIDDDPPRRSSDEPTYQSSPTPSIILPSHTSLI